MGRKEHFSKGNGDTVDCVRCGTSIDASNVDRGAAYRDRFTNVDHTVHFNKDSKEPLYYDHHESWEPAAAPAYDPNNYFERGAHCPDCHSELEGTVEKAADYWDKNTDDYRRG